MIKMFKSCRSNPQAPLFVILIAGVWTTYCISIYLVVGSDPHLNPAINSQLTSKNNKTLQNIPLAPEPNIMNNQNKSQNAFPSVNATRIMTRKKIQDFLHFVHKNESQLIPELGGVPVRCMLSTTWRSGSTFTAQSLAMHPGTFEHYEPLWRKVGQHKIRSLSKDRGSLRELENQLHCNYTALKETRGVNLVRPGSARWFGQLKSNHNHSLEEISSYCSLYPIQIIKVLRLGSQFLKTLLEDPSLNLRVILMVRDPRALLNSRNKVDFCRGECKNATIICQDYYVDNKVLKELEHVFPGRIMGIRFEDVASNPEKVFPEIYDFCGLDASESLQQFIRKHTKTDEQGYLGEEPYNTFRNTSNVSVEWKQNLTWPEIDEIQSSCREAMDAWGYNRVDKDNKMDVDTFTATIP